MTIQRIITVAEQARLQVIGISDHIDSPDAVCQKHLLENFEILEKLNPSIDVRIGCETLQFSPSAIAIYYS